MSKYLVVAMVVVLCACKDDVIDFDYDPGRMHYDGVNANAPFLTAGTAEAAAKFPHSVLKQYNGKEISGVELFIFDLPASCSLVFYETGNSSTPGSLLFEKEITNEIDAFQWNTINLDSNFPIPAEGDLWIALQVMDTVSRQVIGCDAGPTKEGGDWLFQSDDGQWRTFRSRSPADRINWNIRAVID